VSFTDRKVSIISAYFLGFAIAPIFLNSIAHSKVHRGRRREMVLMWRGCRRLVFHAGGRTECNLASVQALRTVEREKKVRIRMATAGGRNLKDGSG
jgi:hypothetical protein